MHTVSLSVKWNNRKTHTNKYQFVKWILTEHWSAHRPIHCFAFYLSIIVLPTCPIKLIKTQIPGDIVTISNMYNIPHLKYAKVHGYWAQKDFFTNAPLFRSQNDISTEAKLHMHIQLTYLNTNE